MSWMGQQYGGSITCPAFGKRRTSLDMIAAQGGTDEHAEMGIAAIHQMR